jgi:hypothetical protein
MFAAALGYARGGWPVFPCRPGLKVPATRHGLKDASNDPDLIWSWWDRMPTANVAIATGAPGPDVVDIDIKNGSPGAESRARLARAGLLRGAFAEIITPSGGAHLYYIGTSQRNSVRARLGVDFRSRGGYVLAPPSIVDGRAYVLGDRLPVSAGQTVDWSAIVAYLDPPRPRKAVRHTDGPKSFTGLIAWMSERQQGERNAALFWAARCMVDDGGVDADFAALGEAAEKAGLSASEVDRTIASARRAVA